MIYLRKISTSQYLYLILLGIIRLKHVSDNKIIKGSLTTIILKLLEDNSRMYGYEMTKMVREVTGNKIEITEAALYPALHKLVADGLLTTTSEKVEGRVRKYYMLTKEGQQEKDNKVSNLKESLASISMILNTKLTNV